MRTSANTDLIMAMNAKLNDLIAKEVGGDDGSFLPIPHLEAASSLTGFRPPG
jgi:hypothetical protein